MSHSVVKIDVGGMYMDARVSNVFIPAITDFDFGPLCLASVWLLNQALRLSVADMASPTEG